MVILHVKRGDESQFLLATSVDASVDILLQEITAIYNGRLKVGRVCSEMAELAEHGITLPPNMQGLTDEQIVELKLKDEWEEKCVPSGGAVFKKDDVGRRNGQGWTHLICKAVMLMSYLFLCFVSAPNDKMKEVLLKTVDEVKALVSKKQAEANVCVTMAMVKEGLDQLRGATMIVYPMGLPPHDPIRMEFEDCEDLSGTQASLQVLAEDECQLWWAAKEMQRGKKLQDYIGKNDKTKLVVKIQKKGQGAPAREPLVSDEQHKQMMLHYYRRQEELKKLEEADDDTYLDSEWSDRQALKRQFQGLTNIKWGPR
ncbi:cilia- and flagella-associated protein 298-like isoform X1 [Dunckerocampus dactyliophorus]|uniref:cilia- and flagella-associated protein 298-like isoform X1 n=1 Tax=Dunckerocampus dactyliophorus TaxID=161453 RepID=UPI002405DEFF|nr:cilia- and flagella-associated protein 298-like isoform X1 [Dunckerocampus dactyliophorus]XP_054611101.1 cilia- and flagella-associated protein 298-like isoform X1 [Dunckerocampus dactyliophorus]XP_054636567.1 cilia- and flagella-associated protein 298-like isoform X1 [Dunckerocampus dactyliophorus]XP_054636568.1 cilia- and flagella-associated protein 298-like isoform X1 [Dunckerocampus dactyliophorus]